MKSDFKKENNLSELKLSLLLFFGFISVLIIVFLLLPFSWKNAAFALTDPLRYQKGDGDNLTSDDWNNLPNDFLDKDGDTMSGDLNMGTNRIMNLADPVEDGDAVNLSTLNAATGAGGAANISDGTNNLFVYCGRTLPGATNWIQGVLGKYVDIDISAANFTEGSMPYIFTSIGGLGQEWISRGATSISATNPASLNNMDDIFRIYILDDSGVPWDTFIARGWYINWCAYGW